MKKQRRRGTRSDWLLALQRSRNARDLRLVLPTPVTVNTPIRADHEMQPHLPDEDDGIITSGPHHNQSRADSTNGPELEDLPYDHITEDGNANDYEQTSLERRREHAFQPFEQGECSLDGAQDQTPEARISQSCSPDANVNYPSPPCAGRRNQLHLSTQRCDLCSQRNSFNTVADTEKLKNMRQKWENRLNLTAVVAIVGSVRYTVDQYQYTRSLLRDEVSGSGQGWPPYSRSHQYFQDILSSCLPESGVVRLPKKTRNFVRYNPDLEGTTNGRGDHLHSETEKVRVFFPSAWAKFDVATVTVFNQMFPTNSTEDQHLESARIVQDRESVIDCCDGMFILDEGQHVSCGPGSVIKVSAQRSKPRCNTPFVFSTADGEYSFTAKIVATWCVGSEASPTPSFERVNKLESLTTYDKHIIVSLSTAAHRPQDPCGSHFGVLPGDICTLLSAERVCRNHEYSPVIIHRFWRYEEGMPSALIIWVSPSHSSSTAAPHGSNLSSRIAEGHVVARLSLSRLGVTTRTHPPARVRGLLADGTPFVVYRILLYCDDFQKSSQTYPQGSAGGCYFLPLCIPPEGRRSTSSVRIISLTPPGVSTNEVLYYIADDLVHASTCGVDGFTPAGEKIRIFVDVMGYVADYPASAGVVDVIGHVARTPCTLCSFRRLHESETEGSKYGSTTRVHAGSSAFQRFGERHLAMRRSEISDRDALLLGMVSKDGYIDRSCPLLYLHERLQSRRHRIPLTSAGRTVVSGLFDPYCSNVVAPDHLLTGLSKDILNTVFECLPTQEMRVEADVYICAALRDNGLLPQREVFNLTKKILHSMTLSELFCVLLVAVPTLRIVTSQCSSNHICREAILLLNQLHRLIALTYWCPQRSLDGGRAEFLVHRRRDVYISELKSKSKSYVEAVDKFCSRNTEFKSHLDKQNLHKIVELYEHTISAFGHVREFMELIFESAHQPLKRCIARSNNHDAHLFAVEHCVGNDWQGRLAALSRDVAYENPSTQLLARRGLRRLLLGREADLLQEKRDKAFIEETDPILESLFTRALREQFGKDNMISNYGVAKHST